MIRPFILSASMTKFGKLQESGRNLAVSAAKEAIEKAGISAKEIQLTIVSNAFGFLENQIHIGPIVNTSLGIPEVPSLTVESACSSSSGALREAFVNVAGGFYDVVLVVGVEKLSHVSTMESTTYFSMGSDYPYEAIAGATFPGLYATIATAYMNEYKKSDEILGAVALKNHHNALSNPKAHIRKEISYEDYKNSKVIAYPLKLYDACPFSDGASAALVVSEEYAKKHTDVLISIEASTRAGSTAALQDRSDLTTIPGARIAAKKAFEDAGITPKKISFSEVHDCFTIAEIVALEDIGFFPKGEGGKGAIEGDTQRDGKIPINVSGGLKAKGHPVSATGLAQVAEVYEQMTQNANGRQLSNTEYALTHNVGATGGSVSIHIFRRVR